MKNENYINIQGWMINNLNLKGNELILYAIIYGFSQDGQSEYYGSQRYIAKALCLSLPTTNQLINKLLDKKLIIKTSESHYKASVKETYTDEVLKKVKQGVKESLTVGVKESLTVGVKESYTNNNNTNNNYNNSSEQGSQTLIPEVLKEMEKIDPVNKTLYGNITQRKACQYLIDTYKFENVIKMINLIANNKGKIFNIPTTPLQLQNRWVGLINDQVYKKNNTKHLELA